MAERHLAATYNTPEFKIFDNYTYVICGDGCLQEGVSAEASSLAGHLGLGKLIVLYDDNNITIDGSTDLSFTEDVQKRYEAYGWHVQEVADVSTQLDDLRAAIENAKGVTDKPSIIACKTVIGYGAPNKQNTHGVHGAPLGANEMKLTKEFYGLPEEKFFVPEEVKAVFTKATEKNESILSEWQATMEKYQAAHPEKAQEIQRRFKGELPEGWEKDLPTFTIGTDKDVATRKMSEQCITAIHPLVPEMVGGSADLTPSNLTMPKGGSLDFQKGSPEGRYIRFGIREHAMGAICNGMFAYGGMRPYCGTFLTFFGYMAGAVRLSALSKFGIIYVFTHDSIGLGEDGPTHQPIETLENMRSMPNINVFRPADSNEMVAAYKSGMMTRETPTAICCSRSTVKALYGSSVEKGLKGAYVAVDAENPSLILIGTGSEVEFCVDAAKLLTESGTPTRVVSMPCQELFLQQSIEYQKSVLPGDIPTLSVEAAAVHGWHRFSHAQVGMTSFGTSAPGKACYKKFGFTPEDIKNKGQQLVEHYQVNGPVPNISNRPVF